VGHTAREMEKVTVAHIRDSGGIFGAERVILTIGNNIDDRYRVILLCLRSPDGRSDMLMEKASRIGVKAFPVDVNGKVDPRSIKSIRDILKRNGVQILHSHDFKSNIYGLIGSANLGIKRILTAGGTTRDSFVKKMYMYFDETFTYRYYDKIIAVSEEIRDRLLLKRMRPGKVSLVENGIDMSLYEHDEGETTPLDSLPGKNGKKVFAVVGRLFPDKGHRYFLAAFRNVMREVPDVAALIVGEGPSEAEIREQAKSLNMAGNVFFCGVRRDMLNVYKNIDCLVIPSLTEGLPYVLLEAMMCKVPVLATSVGGIPKVVTNGRTGYLVPPGDVESLEDGMRRILADPGKAREMSENGYQLVAEKYSAQRMVDRVGRLYDAMLGDPKGHVAR
jgi:glycosyltransferase involved in cell wall biosynthesis